MHFGRLFYSDPLQIWKPLFSKKTHELLILKPLDWPSHATFDAICGTRSSDESIPTSLELISWSCPRGSNKR